MMEAAWQNWLSYCTTALDLCYSLQGQLSTLKDWKERSKQVQSQAKVWALSPPLMPVGWQDYCMYKEGHWVERQKNWACAEAFWNEEHK